jgi:hypothetical protein
MFTEKNKAVKKAVEENTKQSQNENISEEDNVLVVSQIPKVDARQIKLEDGLVHNLVTIEEALTEILQAVRDMKQN